jgi:hypothetical protein
VDALVCQDLATGNVLGVRVLPGGPGFSGPMLVGADGFLMGVRGWTFREGWLLAATPAMEVRGRFALPREDTEERVKGFWTGFTGPSLAGGRLFLRAGDVLLAYRVAEPDREGQTSDPLKRPAGEGGVGQSSRDGD